MCGDLLMATIAPTSESKFLVRLIVNDRELSIAASPTQRLSRILREQLALTGTKVGCDAGDCGACTVLLDGEPVCSCLVALGQVENHSVTTVEGLKSRPPLFDRLQEAFLRHGAAQCGACTPGMLVSATALLERSASPSEADVMDALGGVLCRCTGYRKIISAVLDAGPKKLARPQWEVGGPVGKRLVRLDGARKVLGTDIFGADAWPADALELRVIRSPFDRAAFQLGDFRAYL